MQFLTTLTDSLSVVAPYAGRDTAAAMQLCVVLVVTLVSGRRYRQSRR